MPYNAALKTFTVYLFSDVPGAPPLWTKDFAARNYQDADRKAAVLVRPVLSRFSNAEDWVVEEKVGKQAGKGLPSTLDHLGLYEDILRLTRTRTFRQWTPQAYQGFAYDVLYLGDDFKSSLRIRVPRQPDQYQWSPRARQWLKSRKPLQEEERHLKPVSPEMRDFAAQPPDEIIRQLEDIPASMLPSVVLLAEILPPEVVRWLKRKGYPFRSAVEMGYKVATPRKARIDPEEELSIRFLLAEDFIESEGKAKVAGKAAPGSKGQVSVKQGRFTVWYLPKYQEHVPGVLEGLKRAEQLYAGAGYALPNNIPVLMAARGWGSQRSIYTTANGGFIQLVPAAFTDKANFATFIHELAHYLHSHGIPGGFMNRAINGQYDEMMSERPKDTGGNPVEKAQDALKQIDKEFGQILKNIRPGMRLDVRLPLGMGFKAPEAVRPVKVVSKSGRGSSTKVVMEYLEPTADERQMGIMGNTLPLHIFIKKIAIPGISEAFADLEQRREKALEAYNNAAISQMSTDTRRYEDHRSTWFPTDYSKENAREWFAELVTARLLAPGKMDAEVKSWLDTVVKTGSAPGTKVEVLRRAKVARSNAKIVEVPSTYHPVEVQEPKATRKEFPFQGFIDFQGIKIDVENLKGSIRSKKKPDGDGEWSTYMHAHYGEIRGTEGVDGDKLDVYVGDNHDSSLVVVIHQHTPWDGKYDEDKVMLGYDSVEAAIGAYKAQYDRPGFYKDGEHTAMPIGAFWRWVHEERNKGKKVKVAKVRNAGFQWRSVSRLDATTLAQAHRVKWVRIRSNGQMGEVVAGRLPRGWNVQYLKPGEQYDPKNIKGRPKTDAQMLQLYKEHAGYSPAVLFEVPDAGEKGRPSHTPAPAVKPPPQSAPATSSSVTPDEVTSFLRAMTTRKGGRNLRVDYYPPGKSGFRNPFWSAEPNNRQRLDHYVGSFDFRNRDDDMYDSEGWNEEAWREEYADPLASEVQTKLDQRFGKGLFDADIGEKGHIDVQATNKGLVALGMASGKAAALWKRGYAEGSPGAVNAAKVMLSNLLAMLRAIGWNHLTSHWQIGGDSSYGDHLLFQRLYEKVVDETDTFAEKLVGTFGIGAVDAQEQAKLVAFTLSKWDIGCPFERSLTAERALQVHLKKCIDALKDIGQLSLGMEDFLQGMANDHDTHIYLLQQRQGGVKMAKALSVPKPAREMAARYILRNVHLLGRTARSYQDYAKEKKDKGERPLPKDEWEARVDGKGGDGKKKKKKDDQKGKADFDPKSYKKLVNKFKDLNDKHIKHLKSPNKDPEGEDKVRAEQAKLKAEIDRMDESLSPEDRQKLYKQFWKDPFWKKVFRQHKYGVLDTPDYEGHVSKLADDVIKSAGWWAISPGNPGLNIPPVNKGKMLNALPGVEGAGQALYNGDGPADIMDQAIKDIVAEYEQTWGRKPYLAELEAVWDFCASPNLLLDAHPNNSKMVEDAIEKMGAEVVAGIFTPSSWKKYKKEHPNADPKNHTIKKPDGEGSGGDSDKGKGGLLNKIKSNFPQASKKMQEVLRKAPAKVHAFVLDPKERKEQCKAAAQKLGETKKKVAKKVHHEIHHVVHTHKDALNSVRKLAKRPPEPITKDEAKALITVAIAAGAAATAGALSGSLLVGGAALGKATVKHAALNAVHKHFGNLFTAFEGGVIVTGLAKILSASEEDDGNVTKVIEALAEKVVEAVQKGLEDGLSDEDMTEILNGDDE